jgi:hypothetical protein
MVPVEIGTLTSPLNHGDAANVADVALIVSLDVLMVDIIVMTMMPPSPCKK